MVLPGILSLDDTCLDSPTQRNSEIIRGSTPWQCRRIHFACGSYSAHVRGMIMRLPFRSAIMLLFNTVLQKMYMIDSRMPATITEMLT